MLVRRSVPLLVTGVLAAAGCRDVNQRDPAPVLALAAFDTTTPIIPFPNDLILQGAPGITDARRAGLFQLIELGGWPPDLLTDAWRPAPTAPQGIYVFVRAATFDEGTGAYTLSGQPPVDIDEATVNADTVAFVQLDADVPAIPPTLVAYSPVTAIPGAGAIILRPGLPSCSTPEACILPPGRYVVAIRGGRDGVQMLDDDGTTRIPLQADRAIAIVAANKDLSVEENRPPRPDGTTEEEFEELMGRLEVLRGTFAVGMDWNAVEVPPEPAPDPCLLVLGVSPPEGVCWLPPIPQLGGTLPTPGVMAAFAAVDEVFPLEEIASIQTFEVFAPPMVPELQDEVTP